MIAYGESSAILAWLFDEALAAAVSDVLADADRIVASLITPLECGRALRRGRAAGRLRGDQYELLEQRLSAAVSGWSVLDLSEAVVARVSGPFPSEPVRTLDALHLATADVARQSLGTLTMVSLDQRVRRNAAALGLAVAP